MTLKLFSFVSFPEVFKLRKDFTSFLCVSEELLGYRKVLTPLNKEEDWRQSEEARERLYTFYVA